MDGIVSNDHQKIARVFPRRTRATPDDALAFVGDPPLFVPPVDAVHISVTFTWDITEGRRLGKEWSRVAPVTVGGPAIGTRGEEFSPGVYLAPGYTITSRGCPNRCWFCPVWKRDGNVRELEIRDGWKIQDDNLLACSREHILAVFSMLKRQKCRAEFAGGLEAARFTTWHAETLFGLKPVQVFFAYDTASDWEPLRGAADLLWRAGFRKDARSALRCYVLIGYPRDTIPAADDRLRQVWNLGFLPMAMLYRGQDGKYDLAFRRFQRLWARPAIMRSRFKTTEGSSIRTERQPDLFGTKSEEFPVRV
jgi:hypothetical protein